MTIGPALAPDAEALLAAMADSGLPPYHEMTPAQAREVLAQAGPAMAFPRSEVGRVEDREIEGSGGPLMLRLYAPEERIGPPGPALLFLHGGGWMLGDLTSHDDVCRKLCAISALPVIAVDYRLAPEHPFPAALDDAYAAARWLHEHAPGLGIDPARVAVGGDSAGGNLAAVLALAGARGDLPPFAYQLLLYPVTDLGGESAGYARVTDGLPLVATTMRWFRDAYLADPGLGEDWRVSPLRAASLAGTPPAFVLTAQHDPLCEEGIAYARRLAGEGVLVTHLHYWHHMHGIVSMGAALAEAEGAIQSAAAALRAAVGRN